MPRNVDPGSVSVGRGKVSDGAVEDNSLRNPNRDIQPLKAHIEDPSRAHWAEAIAIEDTGMFFTSDDVEGALAELAGSIAPGAGTLGRTNGVLTGCTYTTVGLTLTIGASSTILRNGVEETLTGLSVALTNNATNYVYAAGATGTLTASTSLPALTTVPILIGRVVTAGGVSTSETDFRFFVVSGDRKPPLTLRSDGAAGNSTAEGAFQSLDAALNYLNLYAGSGVGDEVETHRILVRGTHTLTTVKTIARDNVIFEGEGTAIFIDGTAGTAMFELGTGRVGTQFRDLRFQSNNAATIAIQGTDPADLVVERCSFMTDGALFERGLNLLTASVAGTARLRVQNCYFEADNGISIGRPLDCTIADSIFEGAGATGSGIGLRLGTTANEGPTTVRGCRITAYEKGITGLQAYLTVEDTLINETEITSEVSGDYVSFVNVSAVPDVTDGVSGFDFVGADNVRVIGCQVVTARTVWGAPLIPWGIRFSTSSDGAQIDNCLLDGFYNDTGTLGYGIYFQGAVTNAKVSNTQIRNTRIGIDDSTTTTGDGKVLSNLTISEVEVGLSGFGPGSIIVNSVIDLDVTRGRLGIAIAATAHKTRIQGCRVTNPRDPATYAAVVTYGVWVVGADYVSVDDCEIVGFRSTTSASVGVLFASGSKHCSVNGGYIQDCLTAGIWFAAGTTWCVASGVRIATVAAGIRMDGTDSVVDACLMDLDDEDYSLFGVRVTGSRNKVSDCQLSLTRFTWSGETPYGIALAGAIDSCSVLGNTINTFRNGADILGYGVQVEAGGVYDATITGNRINTSVTGISILEDAYNIVVASNSISFLDKQAIEIDATTDYIRKIAITGNSFYYFETYGVRLLGSVEDISIVGNTIDGFLLADPYNPEGVGVSVVPSTGFPDGIKIVGNSILRCYDGVIVASGTADPITNILVEGNQIHHCGHAQNLSGGVPETFDGRGSKGVGLFNVRNAQIVGNSIWSIGHLYNNAGAIDFPDQGGLIVDVMSNGVYVLDSEQVTVSENRISDLVATGNGLAVGVRYEQISAVIVAATTRSGTSIVDNQMSWDAGLPGNAALFGVAFELIPDATYTQECRDFRVEGNSIRNVASTGVRVVVSDDSTLRDWSVSGNNVSEATSAAIAVTSVSGALGGVATFLDGKVDRNTIRNTSIAISLQTGIDTIWTNQSVSDNMVREIGSRGILVQPNDSADVFTSFSVQGNSLREVDEEAIAFRVGVAGVTFRRISVQGNNLVEVGTDGDNAISFTDELGSGIFTEISVLGNTVDAAGRSAIHFGTGQANSEWDNIAVSENTVSGFVLNGVEFTATTSTSIRGIFIRDNTIVGTASGAGNNGIGLFIYKNAENVIVSGNQILGQSGVGFNGDKGIYVENLSSSANPTYRAWKFSDNVVVMNNGPCLYVLVEGLIEDWLVSGNSFTNEDPTDSNMAIGLAWDGVIGSDVFVDTVQILGNQFIGGINNLVSITDGLKVRNFSFDNNVVRDVATVGFYFITDQAVTGTLPSHLNVSVSGNQFYDIERQGVILSMGASGGSNGDPIHNVKVAGNQFYDCARGGGWTETAAITVSMDTTEAYNLSFVDNQFEAIGDDSNDDYGTIDIRFAGGSGVNWDISGNSFRGCLGHAIQIVDLAVGTLETLSGLTIARNRINANSNGSGIYVDMSAWFSSQNVSIVDNQIQALGAASASARGIYVLSPTSSALNWEVSRNNLFGVGGASMTEGAGIYVILTGDGLGLKVCDNSVFAALGTAIQIDVGADLRNAKIDGNIIDTPAAATHGIFIDNEGAVASAISEHVSVSRNVIRDADQTAIWIRGLSATSAHTLSQWTISENLISNPTVGIWVQTADSGGATAHIQNFIVSNNVLEETAGTAAIYLDIDGDVTSATVAGNTINGGTTGIYFLLDGSIYSSTIANNTIYETTRGIRVATAATGNAVSVSVNGNSYRSTQSGGTGYWFEGFGGTVRTFNMVGNSSNLASAGGTTYHMQWTSIGTGGTQDGMVFVGNNFRSSTNGILATDADFAPAGNNVISGNVSNDGGGLDWADFATEFAAVVVTGANDT